ncbi:MauE/DoxX family redox-associated membrane protein [Paenibacillus sp. DS2015]|uniref:MauE/DoxX family redox-associated membrane protein n=1 Tax=Paenibacillus sp. DS2015 TaxID=3373917 RepID=UPI003D1CB528
MIISIIIWMVSIVIAALYYKSSMQKLRTPYTFSYIVSEYQLGTYHMPLFIATRLAPLLIVVELLTAVWILLPWTRLYGFVLGASLQFVFILLMFTNMGRSFPYGCGCFKMNAPSVIKARHAWGNLVLCFVQVSVVIWIVVAG